MDWFTVDKVGLGKLLERKGKEFVLYELLQNSWDTNAREVRVTLEPLANKPYCRLVVEDDEPEGFADLSHAFTLFAESGKKSDPSKRGRFNLGEKLVLALCEEATITSTTGTVAFDSSGRHRKNTKTERGSRFDAVIRMTRAEYAEVCAAALRVIVPHDCRTWFNGVELDPKKMVESFKVKLPTEIGDAEGYLRRTTRETLVQLYQVPEGEKAVLYEMGIPVVELAGSEPWHINVHQKVPLNSDRDNVTPSYLRTLRTEVLNHMHQFLQGADAATQAWVREAAAQPEASTEAIKHITEERFGAKAVVYDPSDPEGSKLAVQEGYTVIPGGALSKGEWDNIKRDKLVLPAGQVTPSKPDQLAASTPVDPTEGMERVAQLVQTIAMATEACSRMVTSRFYHSPGASVLAHWEPLQKGGEIGFNTAWLGESWFEHGPTEEQIDLILHELGHATCGDHLSSEYNDALTRLGARLALAVTSNPSLLTERW